MSGIRFAFRMLAKTPFVTTVAVLSLALGIGANAAIFSLFDQFLLRSLPVPDPDQLVNLSAPGPKPGSQSCNQAGDCEDVFSYPMFRDLEEKQQVFTGLAAHRLFGANLAFNGQVMSGEGVLVSGSYFPVLGLKPALGRLLGPADDRNIGGHYVVVLSYDYWQNQLGADRGVLDRTLLVNGQPLTVVGVAPEGFRGTTMGARPDVFVPLTMRGVMSPTFQDFDNRRAYWAYLFGRLRPGVTLEQARAELNGLYSGILNEVEAPLQEGLSDATMERFRARQIGVEPGRRGQSSVHEEARTPLLMLFSITAVVLLIACANIANLLLARGAQRAQEMAIRGSLGASRGQLLRQLLTESAVLALAGGAASLFVASWTLHGIGAMLPAEITDMITLGLNLPAVLFSGALALGTGLVFGLYPAVHTTRTDLAGALKAAAGQPSGARSAARFRSVLVTGQIALSMALLVAAGVFIHSLVNVSRVDLGFDTENVVTFSLYPQLNGYTPEQSRDVFLRTEEALAAIPGVTDVSGGMVPLVSGSNWGVSVSVEGFEWSPDVDDGTRFNQVGPSYFRTLGMTLLAGREFTDADDAGAPKVAVINETFARKFGLDPRSAVGKHVGMGRNVPLDIEIVGLVRDAVYSDQKREIPALLFLPYRQDDELGFLTFYLRTATDPAPVIRQIPQVVKAIDPTLPVEELKTLEQQVRENVFLDRFIGTFAAAFAVLATLLAAVGLYGVLAYSVAQRTREIGLRMALGAAGSKVRAMVLRQVGLMTAIGGVLGILAALALQRGARSLLYEVEGLDPLAMAAAAVLLTGVALAAGYAPALRASKVDPMTALRYE